MDQPLILTITGPSGSGKTTLETALCKTSGYGKAISTTTRAPREGEKEGVDYYFISKKEYKKRSDKGLFIESIGFGDDFYGITKNEVLKNHEASRVTVLVAIPEGVNQVIHSSNQNGWDCVSMFVDGDINILKERFIGRDKLADQQYIQDRVARIEAEKADWAVALNYQLIINNLNEGNTEDIMLAIDDLMSSSVGIRHVNLAAGSRGFAI